MAVDRLRRRESVDSHQTTSRSGSGLWIRRLGGASGFSVLVVQGKRFSLPQWVVAAVVVRPDGGVAAVTSNDSDYRLQSSTSILNCASGFALRVLVSEDLSGLIKSYPDSRPRKIPTKGYTGLSVPANLVLVSYPQVAKWGTKCRPIGIPGRSRLRAWRSTQPPSWRSTVSRGTAARHRRPRPQAPRTTAAALRASRAPEVTPHACRDGGGARARCAPP